MSNESHPRIHVAVGIVPNHAGHILVSQRAHDAHQGGLWEFPGGKLHAGESVLTALQRELHEEIGITVISAKPLITVAHDYPDLSVLLDVWWVDSYEGSVRSCENQALQWIAPDHLGQLAMPEADKPIIAAINLPRFYAVTPDCTDSSTGAYLDTVYNLLNQPIISMLQLRVPAADRATYQALVQSIQQRPRPAGTRLILNCEPGLALELAADGVQLSAARLATTDSDSIRRCQSAGLLVGASCHSAAELRVAQEKQVDFAVLGSVNPTTSHPGVEPLGWQQFGALVSASTLPVYAIGGLTLDDYKIAIEHGAQGVAGINTFAQLVSVWNKLKQSKLMQKKTLK